MMHVNSHPHFLENTHIIIRIDQTDLTARNDICPKDICKMKRKGQNWIECERCSQWYHCSCVGLTKAKADKLSQWHCNNCTS